MWAHLGERPVHSFLNVQGPRLRSTISGPITGTQVYSDEYASVDGDMYSFSNAMPPQRYPNSGGPWLMRKVEDDRTLLSLTGKISGSRTVSGLYTLLNPAFSYKGPAFTLDSDPVLLGKGTTAIARSLPNNPAFDLSTAIGEARAGAPALIGMSVWRDKTITARNAGSEYLNADFGWAPLVRDIQSFCRTVVDAENILGGYQARQRQNVRVSYEFDPESRIDQGTGTIGVTPNHLSAWVATGTAECHFSKRTWFDGCYWYHIPMGDAPKQRMQRYASMAHKLLNAAPTPETVWNVSPWSWAADWFGNIGDVMTNISNLGKDGMVLRYGYLMQEVKSVEVIGASVRLPDGSRTNARRTVATVRRTRVPASPYGFSISWDGMSPSQIATTVALGLSRF